MERIKKIKQRTDLYGKVSVVIILISTIPDFYFQAWQNIIAVLVTIGYLTFCIYLNKKVKSTISGTLMSLGANGIAFYSAVNYGEHSRAYLFYIPIFIATFLVTNYRSRYELFVNIFQLMVGIFILNFMDLSYLLDKSLSQESILWFGKFNTLLAMLASIYFLIAFVKEISENEDKLIEAQTKLLDQNDELQKKNDELDRLIYSISHDIKAPLSSIEGLVYITKLDNIQPELNDYFDRMLVSSKRLKDFLENVINFYKNAKFEPKKEIIDFGHEVDQILQNLKFMPNFSEIEFSVKIDDTREIKLDKLRVQTILVNLISNAVKYQSEDIEQKKIEISILLLNSKVKIEVSDNGIGIPHEIQDKIFEMFYRGTVKSDGSGLGLYIISETVKKLDGTIKLESIPDTYTKFIVELPYKP